MQPKPVGCEPTPSPKCTFRGTFDSGAKRAFGRYGNAGGGGLQYHSPHKFRHGHAVYALSMAKDVATLKAVSQNLMHENLAVTDGVYGVLSDTDVKRQIAALGASRAEHDDVEELKSALVRLLARLGEA